MSTTLPPMTHQPSRLDAPVVIEVPTGNTAKAADRSAAKVGQRTRARQLVGPALLATLLGGGVLYWQQQRAAAPPQNDEPAAAAVPALPTGIVELPLAQQTEAGIRVEPVQLGSIQLTRRVPGRVAYNANRVVEIRAPAGGVVKAVFANQGDRVERGQQLLALSSSDVGLARDAVLQHEAELRLAEQQFDWSRQTGVNVQSLVTQFDTRPSIAEIEKLFAEKPLGTHREQIMSAYSRVLLAEAGADQLKAAESAGAVSQRLANERRSEREVAAAAFRSAIEQARFASKQQQDRDQAAVRQAERLLAISRERLAALVGPYGQPIAEGESRATEYSTLLIHAPWPALVEARPVVASSNVAAADALITLVDLDTVWINAELYEQDYAAIDLSQTKQLHALVPAVSNQPQLAQVRFTSTGVSQQTQSIALVAELPNTERRYRPGMFAWIELPAETKTDVLTVPPGALVRQDGETYVFVADGEQRFRRVDIELGAESGDKLEVRRGLAAGDRVVTAGAFTLKSELLLAAESGEE